ncbi:MAG TPA: YetF domain-containing protein [Holophagaceae bacterium]|nr:YetF domain-containing protein [Holophagaceae bacterium]
MHLALLDGIPVGVSMWKTAQPWWEFVLRALVVYGFLLVALRLTGKRQVGQLAPFDFVLLLVLSNAVQNSMNAGDNTVSAGIVLVLTLLAINGLMSWLTYRSKGAELLLEGKPQILIHNGVVDKAIMSRERITQHELMSAIRQVGVSNVDEVRVAILENTGRINVIPKNGKVEG